MNENVLAAREISGLRARAGTVPIYFELTKPRLTMLAVITALLGYYLGSSGEGDFLNLFSVFFGAALVGGGANALNQFFERDTDRLMRRTENRPLPARRLTEEQAFNFGLVLCVSGVLWFMFFVNLLSGFMAFLTLVSYLIFYTPLKKKTPLALFVGAIPGALPPVMGWTSAAGVLSVEAWGLFAILFFWQLPHFLAIGWMCREDYQRAGIPVLSAADADGRKTSRRITIGCGLLLAVSLLPWVLGLSRALYGISALVLGAAFLSLSLGNAKSDPDAYARRLFFASIIYLPLLMTLMALDKS